MKLKNYILFEILFKTNVCGALLLQYKYEKINLEHIFNSNLEDKRRKTGVKSSMIYLVVMLNLFQHLYLQQQIPKRVQNDVPEFRDLT